MHLLQFASRTMADGMEPNSASGGLPDVYQPNVAGEPTPLLLVVDSCSRVAFHDFYALDRDRIGRALAVTLRDADLAAESVDEAMARAYARWSSVSAMAIRPAGCIAWR